MRQLHRIRPEHRAAPPRRGAAGGQRTTHGRVERRSRLVIGGAHSIPGGFGTGKPAWRACRRFQPQVRLLWDEKWLYIRFTCTATEIYSPFTHHGDKLYQGDVVEVFLDPKGDAKQWMEIEVSPNNVTMEVQTTVTAEPKSDADLMLQRDIISHDFWNNLDFTFWKAFAPPRRYRRRTTRSPAGRSTSPCRQR